MFAYTVYKYCLPESTANMTVLLDNMNMNMDKAYLR